MPLFLGLDTGTSGTKAVLLDETGAVRASDTQEYPLSTPHPQWAEQHPDHDWWRAAQAAIPAVLAKAGVTGAEVGGVGLTGLAAGTPVVGGGGDQAAGAVGCGAVEGGIVSSTVGTSGVVFAHSDEPFFDPEMRIQTFCHAVPGAWFQMGCVLSAGGSLRWYRDTLAPGESYDAITEAAAMAPPGCEGLLFLPYLTGERTPHPDPDARGVFFGATLRTEKPWLARAVLEGVAYALKDSFTLLADIGVPVAQVRASGGGARSPLWLQIQADVIGHPHVLLNVDEGPAFGAALLAGVGTGAFRSVPEACRAAIRPGAETRPDAANAAVYRRYYPIYQGLYPALRAAFAEVSRVSAG